MVDARELTGRFPAGLRRGERMTLARFGPAAISAIGLLLALAGTLSPTEEGAASGSLATRLIIPLPDSLIAAQGAPLAATSPFLLSIILSPAPPRRKKWE